MPRILPMPPASFLSERFLYCSETGILTYRVAVSQRRRAGDEAGFVHHQGYRFVKLTYGGKKYQIAAHRIAWAVHYKECPPTDREIDHIDRDKLNNRIWNLRLVTRVENARNKSAGNHSCHPGVSRRSSGLWRAYTYKSGRYTHLGHFETEREAISAVQSLRR